LEGNNSGPQNNDIASLSNYCWPVVPSDVQIKLPSSSNLMSLVMNHSLNSNLISYKPVSSCRNLQRLLKNTVFWNVTPCGSCKNRRFGGTWRLIMEALRSSKTSVITRATRRKIPEDGILQVVSSSSILVTLMMEAIRSCETSVRTRATRCNIPEEGILHSHRRIIRQIITSFCFVTFKY
jgi:hypothetical protein